MSKKKNELGIRTYILRFILIFCAYFILTLILYTIPYFGWQIIFKKAMPTNSIIDNLLLFIIFVGSIITQKRWYKLKKSPAKKNSRYKIKQRYGFLALFLLIVVGLFLNNKIDYLLSSKTSNNLKPTITQALIPTNTPTLAPSPTKTLKQENQSPQDTQKWGVGVYYDGIHCNIKFGEDERMATAQEIFEALNQYRIVNGRNSLAWDDKLGNYAQSRAEYINSIGKDDSHSGLNDFLNNQDGYLKLGFKSIGENLKGPGKKVLGVHIIEWGFGKCDKHNENQLQTKWTNSGIGVSGTSVVIIFGANRF